jgi:hypothetical protein
LYSSPKYDEIKGDEMGEAYSTHGRDDKFINCLGRKVLGKVQEKQKNRSFGRDLYVSEEVTVVGFCEHGDELPDSIKCEESFYTTSIE